MFTKMRMRYNILFFILFIIWFVSSSYAFQFSQQAIDATQNSAIINLSSNINRISADVMALTVTVSDLSAAINRFTGIGIAIGLIGGLIVIMQTLQVRKKNG